MRAMRGADVSSDHHLLITAVRFGSRGTPASKQRTEKVLHGTAQEQGHTNILQDQSLQRFQPQQESMKDSETDTGIQWDYSMKLWLYAFKGILWEKKTHHKEWISSDSIEKIEKRKEKKAINTEHKLNKSS
jgi:hypothetical protein